MSQIFIELSSFIKQTTNVKQSLQHFTLVRQQTCNTLVTAGRETKLTFGGLNGYSAGKTISILNAPLLYGGSS